VRSAFSFFREFSGFLHRQPPHPKSNKPDTTPSLGAAILAPILPSVMIHARVCASELHGGLCVRAFGNSLEDTRR